MAQRIRKSRAPKPKARYRVANWREYNRALAARGSITLWIDEAVLRSRSFDRQQAEAAVAVRCINRFTDLGMPRSIRIV